MADTATDLFWLAGLGWEHLDKHHEQTEQVYDSPDSVPEGMLTANWSIAMSYCMAVQWASGKRLPVIQNFRHPSNLPMYRWFDNQRECEPATPQLADYIAAFDRLFLVIFALSKLEGEIDKEYELIRVYLECPQWPSWASAIWGWRSNSSQQQVVEGTVELWLPGSGWDTQGEERAKLVAEGEKAWQHAQTLVEDAKARGELAMAKWALPQRDAWSRMELDC